ncbi:hypothetical protein SUGI_0456570 [Cryptomeria japonica]|nr:hypothetical protein SUGI_0456570 [Cryptomeria japonica]
MGRGKVQLKKIENKTNRHVTFCKRKSGLLKKAKELSVLCDAELALLVYSNSGKLYQYASNSVEKTIQRYIDITAQRMQPNGHFTVPNIQNLNYWQEEVRKLRHQSDSLMNSIRQLTGEALEPLSISELHQLEIKMEKSLACVRSTKEEMLFEKIENLQTRLKEIDGDLLSTQTLIVWLFELLSDSDKDNHGDVKFLASFIFSKARYRRKLFQGD